MKILAKIIIFYFIFISSSYGQGLFDAMKNKMKYTNQNQNIISQNIANANTPKYKTMELAPVDFSKSLVSRNIKLRTTSPKHITPPRRSISFKERRQRDTYETKPNGNNVSLEEQVVKMSENDMEFRATAGSMKQMSSLLKAAIGDSRQ